MKKFLYLVPILFLSFQASKSFAGTSKGFYALYPQNGSKYVSLKTGIIIKYSGDTENNFPENLKIAVTGSASGVHTGTLISKPEFKTLIFKPAKPFAADEKVNVRLYAGTKKLLEYTFATSPLEKPVAVPQNIYGEELGNYSGGKYATRN